VHIIRFIKSFYFFTKLIFIKKHYNVIFFYPAHFNRGIKNENEFFQPFYEICKKNDIKFLAIEEPELFKSAKSATNTVPFDFILIIILILRKVIPLKKFNSFQHREWHIAKLLKPIFFRNLTFDNYITISNSMLGFFRGLSESAKLYDYQHGVITSKHTGYLDCTTKLAAEHIRLNDVNIMVHGNGFANVLKRSVEDEYYDSHVFVVGKNDKKHIKRSLEFNFILFSLQFADFNPSLNKEILYKINNFFIENKKFFIENDIFVLLKHHPRFSHDIDPSPLYDFPFTKHFKGTLFDALEKCFAHITFHSTTTFEAASIKVPTLLLKNNLMDPEFFVNDYKYPLGIKNEQEIIESIYAYLHNESKYQQDSYNVYNWYKKFYSDIDESLFLELLKSQKETN